LRKRELANDSPCAQTLPLGDNQPITATRPRGSFRAGAHRHCRLLRISLAPVPRCWSRPKNKTAAAFDSTVASARRATDNLHIARSFPTSAFFPMSTRRRHYTFRGL